MVTPILFFFLQVFLDVALDIALTLNRPGDYPDNHQEQQANRYGYRFGTSRISGREIANPTARKVMARFLVLLMTSLAACGVSIPPLRMESRIAS